MSRSSLASLVHSEVDADMFYAEKEESVGGGMRRGIQKPRYELLAEYPFDSSVKRMSMLYRDHENLDVAVVLLKGSVRGFFLTWSLNGMLIVIQAERVLEACTAYATEQTQDELGASIISDDVREKILAMVDTLAGRGLRVLALASRRIPFTDMGTSKTPKNLSREVVETACLFLGLVGIYDPPRPETVQAIRACKDAGITVHM